MVKQKLKALLSLVQDEDVIRLVESFGGAFHHQDDRHLWFTTVCHGGDSSKLCYNCDTKNFYCYTNCGYMSIPSFISHAGGVSYREAMFQFEAMVSPYLRQGVGVLHGLVEQQELEELKEMLEQITHTSSKAFHFTPVKGYPLDCFEDNVFYEGWIEEGISIETMQTFGIRWDELNLAIIIPHYDIESQLIGIRTRQLAEGTGKYLPLVIGTETYNHPLGMNLYGIHLHKKAVERYRQAVIVEGEKSVMQHHTWYGKDSTALAVCGFHVTGEQRDMLLRLDVEEVILAFDKDVDMDVTPETITDAYERYCEKVNHIGRQFAPYCKVSALVDGGSLLGLKDSPTDKGQEVFEELMRKRQFISP